MSYVDRADAGRTMAPEVAAAVARRVSTDPPLILGVPRGGVAVAAPIARSLSGELDIALAKKIGSPNNPELAIGALGEWGDPVFDPVLIERLRVSDDYLEAATAVARKELQRRAERFRREAMPPEVAARIVIVVDDGIATGATLQATLQAISRRRPGTLICAVPVGAPESVRRIAAEVDEMICPLQPRWFRAVGEWYDSFDQTSDEEVIAILRSARGEGRG